MTTPIIQAPRSSVLKLRPDTSGLTYLNVVAGPYGVALHRVPVPKGTWIVQLSSSFAGGARVQVVGGINSVLMEVPGRKVATPLPTAMSQLSADVDGIELMAYALAANQGENAQVTITLYPVATL